MADILMGETWYVRHGRRCRRGILSSPASHAQRLRRIPLMTVSERKEYCLFPVSLSPAIYPCCFSYDIGSRDFAKVDRRSVAANR